MRGSPAPALEHGADEMHIVAGGDRRHRRNRGFAARQLMRRYFLEAQPGRKRHAFAESQHFAGAERGNERQQVGGGVRDRRAQQRLGALVGEAHREQRVALGNDGGVEFGRTLGDEPEIDPVFAAFLGDTRDGLAGRPEADVAVGGGVTVSLFADEQQRRDAVAPQPEIECHAAQHRAHGIDDLGREAGELHDGHRPAVGRQPEQMADDFGHGIAADIGVIEHERVTRIVAHGLDARIQLVIDDARRAVLELAHPFVDQRNQVDQPIGNRRVDGIADRLGIDALQPDAVGVLVLRIDSLRHRNDFGENVELLRHAGAAGEQHIDDLFEIEQPERQLQVTGIEHQRTVAEATAVFVVNVEQEYPQVRPCFKNFVEQQRYAARFADAGAAEYREVLGEHFLDIDIGDHGPVLLQRADGDLIRSGRCINRAKLLIVDQVDDIADGGIVGDAALKFGALRSAEDFAEQVDRGAGDVNVRSRHILAGYFRDHGDDDGICAADADKPADGGPYLRDAHLARRQKSDAGEGSAYRNYTSEGCHNG